MKNPFKLPSKNTKYRIGTDPAVKCPKCNGELELINGEYKCKECGLVYKLK